MGDISENISSGSITWNVYGKIASITRTATSGGNNTKQIVYSYDASGNRIGKKVVKFGSSEVEHTWYVRDASGNVMAVYSAKKDTSSSAALADFALTLSEQHVYGSSRLGVQQREANVEAGFTSGKLHELVFGKRSYELSNHLGNVLATISDRKIGIASSNSSLIDHYEADVVSAQDYYPFGMGMPGRTYSASHYRYGFNGKENDNEVKGEGNQQDYGMRIYDPRAARFLSVDAISKSYPWLTPYQFASNNPILGIDMDGLEFQEHRLFFDTFILPFLKFGNGGVLYAQGSVQKAEAMSGRADYQNENVPRHVQEKLAKKDITQGTSKQVIGATEMVVASAEVVSAYTPMATDAVLTVGAPKVAKAGKWVLNTEAPKFYEFEARGAGELPGLPSIFRSESATNQIIKGNKTIGLGLDQDLAFHRGSGAIT